MLDSSLVTHRIAKMKDLQTEVNGLENRISRTQTVQCHCFNNDDQEIKQRAINQWIEDLQLLRIRSYANPQEIERL